MTQTVKPTRKSDIDPNFHAQLKEQQTQAKKEYEKRNKAEQHLWLMPVKNEWSGDLFDWDPMIKKPFKRDVANDMYEAAVKDALNPGVSGDLIITTTQIDYLAIMGRAFSARHTMRWPRAVAHSIGRRRAQGDPGLGLFMWGIYQYVKGLIEQSTGKD